MPQFGMGYRGTDLVFLIFAFFPEIVVNDIFDAFSPEGFAVVIGKLEHYRNLLFLEEGDAELAGLSEGGINHDILKHLVKPHLVHGVEL